MELFRRFGTSLTAKILSLLLLIMLIGNGAVVGYFLIAQNQGLVQERASGVEGQTAVLFQSIKNNMLVGRAPLARKLMQDLQEVEAIREIILFRANGQEAFSDNQTIQSVNQKLGKKEFEMSEVREDYVVDRSERFQRAIDTRSQQSLSRTGQGGHELVYYVPLLIEPDCTECHDPTMSPDPDVRGVVRVATSLGDVDRRIRQNVGVSMGIWVVTVVVLTVIIILNLDRLVLRRLKTIGRVAEAVEGGDLEVEVPIRSEDEIGHLGRQINRMIVGLNERLKLSKFVSQATLEQVVSGSELVLGGEKRRLTVLFSDIRGFTAYAEQRDPQEVIETLNVYMQRQAGIILRAGGDVDQFVGDEILGVFRSDTMAEDAVRAGLQIVAAIDELNARRGLDIHVGIGIHTGSMIEGNVGARGDVERLQRTVIGDAVNVGSRVCGLAGPGEVLVSRATCDLIRGRVVLGEPRTLQVKGKREPITVCSIQGLQSRTGPDASGYE